MQGDGDLPRAVASAYGGSADLLLKQTGEALKGLSSGHFRIQSIEVKSFTGLLFMVWFRNFACWARFKASGFEGFLEIWRSGHEGFWVEVTVRLWV